MLNTLGDFSCECFLFEGKEAIVVFPEERKANGKWALKTEYWGAFPEVEIMLLREGFHVAYVANETRFATSEDCHRKARFADFISEKYGISEKCVPIGMSCGGAHAIRFAGLHPKKVSCIYIDAPVLNYCSFPGKIGDEECERVWEREFSVAYPNVKRYQLLSFSEHPICCSETIIENKIPVIMVYGTEDKSVIYEENGAMLEEAFAQTDLLKVIKVGCRGHHPHGMLGDNTPIVEFIKDNI